MLSLPSLARVRQQFSPAKAGHAGTSAIVELIKQGTTTQAEAPVGLSGGELRENLKTSFVNTMQEKVNAIRSNFGRSTGKSRACS
jgi:hypothetical protein